MDFIEIFKLNEFDLNSFVGLIIRFGFNFCMVFIIIQQIYWRYSKRKDLIFTLYIFNLIIFVLCTILLNIELSVGAGFGLFAVFTMMRYRSVQINIKDMTYLLVIVALGFVNATFTAEIGPAEVLFINIAVIIALITMEKIGFRSDLEKRKILYDKLELLKPQYNNLLKREISQQLGLNVINITIESMNYINKTANLIVYCENCDFTKFPQCEDEPLLTKNSS